MRVFPISDTCCVGGTNSDHLHMYKRDTAQDTWMSAGCSAVQSGAVWRVERAPLLSEAAAIVAHHDPHRPAERVLACTKTSIQPTLTFATFTTGCDVAASVSVS